MLVWICFCCQPIPLTVLRVMGRRSDSSLPDTSVKGSVSMRYGVFSVASPIKQKTPSGSDVPKEPEQQANRSLLLHLAEQGSQRKSHAAQTVGKPRPTPSFPARRFHASHQKEAEQNRLSGSQSGYDSDSTINDNDPGRSQNE